MSIVVATDFSLCSQVAVRLAAALAGRVGTKLVVVHVVEEPILDFATAEVGLARWERETLQVAELAIARDLDELRKAGLDCESRVMPGLAVERIRDVVAAESPELVVVGTHGRRGMARFFLGSVAESTVRNATCPVLVTNESTPDLDHWAGRAALRLAIAMDGSVASEAGLSWMRGFEVSHPCDLSLLRIYSPDQEALRYGLDDLWGRRGAPEVIKLVDRDLRQDAEALLGRVPSTVRLRVASADPAEALADEVALLGVDGVVVGIPKHRSHRWPSLALSKVLRASSVPVLCIPEATAPAPLAFRHPSSILLAVDFSDASRAAILPVYGLLQPDGGHVEICAVHGLNSVLTPESTSGAPLDAEQRAVIESRLRALVPPEAAAFGITTSVSVLEGSSTSETILGAAERLSVDLVALGSHGRSGLKRAALGSVAEEVARRCSRPVLIVGDRTQRF